MTSTPRLVASGPNDTLLTEHADNKRYELVEVHRNKKGTQITYNLNIFEEDDIIYQFDTTTNNYASAAIWAIQIFIKVVANDGNTP